MTGHGVLRPNAKQAGSTAQNEVQTKYIPAEIVAKNPDWTLDYKTRVLTVDQV